MKDKDFGDFEEIKNEENNVQEQEQYNRVRTPRKNELIGVIIQRLGGNRMDVMSTDGKTRNCRVPGKYKRKLWLRPKDVVLIIPWEFNNSRGDIIYKYPPNAVNQLRKEGLLNKITEEF